ncbi:hypothetical protein [Crateriforma conspicua]|uniref:FHA domain-containing protein n=1 Tax=Crateriforma conspicua TaxID=2527996 RepID=A0A5C5Y3X8_9PLAN|nr:hypothetical protein [Crateriforma conspicua]TWT69864.1 hypothetical protein Pan14r_21600 [Crateriforma conspicua]
MRMNVPSVRGTIAAWLLASWLVGLDATAVTQAQDMTSNWIRRNIDALSLPTTDPDGRRLRGVGVYKGQYRLIPDDFEAVRIDRLKTLLRPDRDDTPGSGSLKRSVYRARLEGLMLVGDESQFWCDQPTSGKLSDDSVSASPHSTVLLGATNLAIQPASSFALGTDTTGLLQDHAGNLYVRRSESSETTFRWAARGLATPQGIEFDLQIPIAVDCELQIETPADVGLTSDVGVVRQEGSIAGEFADDDSARRRLYVVRAGGLERLRLQFSRSDAFRSATPIVVRRVRTQLEMSASGITWQHRLTIESPSDDRLPSIDVPLGSVESVEINGLEVPFVFTPRGPSSGQLDVAGELSNFGTGSEDDQGTGLALMIRGHCIPDGYGERPFQLRRPRFRSTGVLEAVTEEQLQIRVENTMSLTSSQMPDHWRLARVQPGVDASVWQWEGPPIASNQWIGLTVMPQSELGQCLATLRLQLDEPEHQAQMLLELPMGQGGLSPVELAIQPGWEVDQISFPNSGRIRERLGPLRRGGTITLWPESADLVDQRLLIEIAARFPSRRLADRRRIPATWVARVQGVATDLAAQVERPSSGVWDDLTLLAYRPSRPNGLSSRRRDFLDPMTNDSLFFRNDMAAVPPLRLAPPREDFDAQVNVEFRQSATEIVETVRVLIASGRAPSELSLSIDDHADLPEYQWGMVTDGGGPMTAIRADQTRTTETNDRRIVRFDIAAPTATTMTLVGTRQYAIANSGIRLQLPSVTGAGQQDASILLEDPLFATASSGTITPTPLPIEQAAAPESRFLQRLRYNPDDQVAIRLRRRPAHPGRTDVWQQDTEMIVSSRGSDQIRSELVISSDQTIVIDTPLDLQLETVRRNGSLLEVGQIPQHPIRLPATAPGRRDTIRLTFVRSRLGTWSARKCRVPWIRPRGVVWQSSMRLLPSSETMLLSDLFRPRHDSVAGIRVTPATTVLLLRRELLFALGCCGAFVFFAAGWFVSRLQLVLSAAIALLLATFCLLWTEFTVAFVGWILVPWLVAALLHTSLCKIDRNDRRQSSKNDPSGSFSLSLTRSVLWLMLGTSLLAISGAMPKAIGQNETAPTKQSIDVVDVLLPFDESGSIVGNHVYVPIAALRHWESIQRRSSTLPPLYQSARYTVQLQQVAADEVLPMPTVEAEFDIRLDTATASVRLPIDADLIQRVELIRDEGNSVVRFAEDAAPDSDTDAASGVGGLPASGTVQKSSDAGATNGNANGLSADAWTVVTIPSTDRVRLRLTLVPSIEREGSTVRLAMPIPRIACAQLLVVDQRGWDNIRLNRCVGPIENDLSGRLRSAVLGPIDRISLDYQSDLTETSARKDVLQRRYYVQVGRHQTVIDYELTPLGKTEAGDRVQVLFSDSPPTLISDSWRIVDSVFTSSGRTLVDYQRIAASDQPIRLVAVTCPACDSSPRIDVDGSGAAFPESGTALRTDLVLPSALPAGGDPVTPVYVAMGVAPDISTEFDTESNAVVTERTNEAMTPDQFFASWNGFRSVAQSVQVFSGVIPKMILRIRPGPPILSESIHHLHLRDADDRPDFPGQSRPDVVELQYRYTTLLSLSSAQSPTEFPVTLPPGFELHSVTVDGEAAVTRVLYGRGNRQTFLVQVKAPQAKGAAESSGVTAEAAIRSRLSIAATRRLRSDAPFVWTDLSIWPGPGDMQLTTPSVQHVVTRDPEITIGTSPTGAKEPTQDGESTTSAWPGQTMADSTTGFSSAELNDKGWVQVAAWTTRPGQESPSWSGQPMWIRTEGVRYRCDTTTRIEQIDGEWGFAFQIDFRPRAPEIVDIAVPALWSIDLNVQGADRWLQQPGPDASRQWIRVRRPIGDAGNTSYRLTGRLSTVDRGSIAVPDLEIRDVSVRRAVVEVPSQASGQPLQWRTNGVDRIQATVPGPNVDPNKSSTQAAASPDASAGRYSIRSDQWSVDLVSQTRNNRPLSVATQDIRVIVRPDSTLVACRYFVVPESDLSLEIHYPSLANFLRASVDDRPAVARTALISGTDKTNGEQTNGVTVGLAYAELPQIVDVLFEYPSDAFGSKTSDLSAILPVVEPSFAPEPWSVSETNSNDVSSTGRPGVSSLTLQTLTEYASSSGGNDRNGQVISDWIADENQRRLFALAESIVDVVDGAKDLIAEKPAAEMATWLTDWAEEFRSLEQARLRMISNDDSEQDQRWQQLRDRFAAVAISLDVPLDDEGDSPAGSTSGNFATIWARVIDGPNTVVPNEALINDDAWRSRLQFHQVAQADLRWLLNNVLILFVTVIITVLVWPHRRSIETVLSHPIFWLALLSVCLYVVAPPPIAIALTMIVICFAAFPGGGSRWLSAKTNQ